MKTNKVLATKPAPWHGDMNLVRDRFYRQHYLVLRGKYYHADFVCDNDEDAIDLFNAADWSKLEGHLTA